MAERSRVRVLQAFFESDVDKILLDYTEASNIVVHDFGSGVSKVYTGLAGVTECFTGLFEYLNAVDGNHGDGETTVGDVKVTHDGVANQVFLVWRNVAAGITHATDTFHFDDNGKITTQTVTVWTTADKPVLTQEDGAAVVDLNAAVPDTPQQSHWDNHLDAFGTGDLEKMVLDYAEDAEIIEYDLATDTRAEFTGIAGVRELFPKYFGWAGGCGDGLDVALPVIRVDATYIYLTVTFSCVGIPTWTDTFAIGADGMIHKQNIIFLRADPGGETDNTGMANPTQAGWDNHGAVSSALRFVC